MTKTKTVKTPLPAKETVHLVKVYIEYRRAEKEFFVRDLVDMHNEPAAYTKSKRGLEKVWPALQVLVTTFGPELTMNMVTGLFTQMGIRYHYWCMVD